MTTLHIHCGDCSATTLKHSGVLGEILVWREIYLEGPAPGGLPENEWRRVRAQFLATFGLPFQDTLRGLNEGYTKLAQAGQYAEVILWFDACMFDQTIMIHLIDRLGNMQLDQTALTLICIADRGLGELTTDEMAALLNTRQPITVPQIDLAHAAWVAFTSSDPREIEALLHGDTAALPHLAAALRRHLQQFPSVGNGLNRLQQQALEIVASGADRLGQIFQQVSAREEQAFLGDTSMWTCLDELARGAHPLLCISGPGPIVRPLNDPLTDIDRWTVTITVAGRDVLHGDADWILLNGIDRWLGGVHLHGPQSPCRWDERQGRLVAG